MISFRHAASLCALLAGTAPALAERIENPSAVFEGLDKISGRLISFDVAIGETVQFGALQVTPRVCYTRPSTESPQTTAFLEVDEITLANEKKRIFSGWMFAASPGLHAVEHPVYDIWLTDCKGGKHEEPAPPVAAEDVAAPKKNDKKDRPAGQEDDFAVPVDPNLPVD